MGVCRPLTLDKHPLDDAFLTEIILEFVEDGLLRRCVALEIVALAEVLEGFLFRTAELFRHIYGDVHHEVSTSVPIALHGWKSFSA